MTLDQTIQQHLEKLTLQSQGEVLDFVLYLEQKNRQQSPTDIERRESLLKVLAKVTAANPFADVDPPAWEREQRNERALPGRE